MSIVTGRPGEWEDLGSPWKSNGVTSMASFQGQLHVGVSRVLLHYSGLEPTLSHHIGGKVFRLEADGRWTDLGQLLGLDGVNGLVNFKGELYATGFYQPGFFRFEGGTKWRAMGTPDNLPNGGSGRPQRVHLCHFLRRRFRLSF